MSHELLGLDNDIKAVKNIFFWLSQSFEVGGFIAGVCVADFFFVKNQMNSLAVE